MQADVFVPVLMYPDSPTPESVSAAVRMGRLLGEGAQVLLVEAMLPRLEGHWGSKIVGVAAMAAELEVRQHEAAQALRQHLEPQATVKAAHMSQAQILQAVSVAARTHDLTVISAETSQARELGQTLVFQSGRPVVLVPAESETSRIDRIAIAWDGSRASARAVHDAMPWIRKASFIAIVTAFDDKTIGQETVEDLRAYLGRHGLEAYAEHVSSSSDVVGIKLQDGALQHGADMLIMGAFGHSRIRDFVLGGATQKVFEETKLPIFMSH
ncbi:Universal stress protein family protein [Devosia enhydra]|uniref:Universal stress protein family protein n=1 Tax=Devosia enhydra TaxID=665118 RepID=A0A1K2I2H3_9HYPH|nr:universal stress protein [Devosia enhydra]SFZ85956.1 Universal stress protein family protein [Devosia enhydra]